MELWKPLETYTYVLSNAYMWIFADASWNRSFKGEFDAPSWFASFCGPIWFIIYFFKPDIITTIRGDLTC